MGWTDFNSPNVITNTRGNESELVGIIHNFVISNADDITKVQGLPETCKKLAWKIDNFYMKVVIEAYNKGCQDGFDLRQMTFESIEKRISDAEKT